MSLRPGGAGRESGAVVPEVAITAVFFFTLLFSGIELCRAAYIYAGLNAGVIRAARMASFGVGTSVEDVRLSVQNLSNAPVSEFRLCGYSITPCATNVRGSSGQLMQIAATTPFRFLGFYNLDISSATVFRLEPDFRSFNGAP